MSEKYNSDYEDPTLSSNPSFGPGELEYVQSKKTDWRAFRALVGGFFLMFNSWGIVNAFGTFQSYYRAHLLSERVDILIPLIGGTQSFFILIFSIICGRLIDAGKHCILGSAGGILITLGTFLLSLSGGDGGYDQGVYWAIWLTQGLTVGLGMSCNFVYSSQVVATWFTKHRSLAIGITASGASIAGLVYPVMFKFLVGQHGFAPAVRYMGIVVGITSCIAVLCARPNPATPLRKPESWMQVRVWIAVEAFGNAAYNWFLAGMALLFLGFYPIFFNLENWAQWRGVGVKEDIAGGNGELPGESGFRTFYFLAIMNGSSTLGRVGGAYLCDKFGAQIVHASATALASICVFLFWPLASTTSAAIAFVVIFGVFSGTVIGLPPACVASLLPEREQHRLGHWVGMMYSLSAIPSLLGPVIVGELVHRFEYLPVLGWSGGCLLLASTCMMMSRMKAGPQH